MNLLQVAIVLGYFSFGHSYTKYGRSCKDIGCPNNQECVMQTDPCSYYQRQGECGSYPTCQRVSNSARTCSTYVCPPTKVCKMDGDTPKCVDDAGSVGRVGYETSSNTRNYQSQQSGNSGSLYPHLPKGETTPRPNINRPVNTGGYQGGQVGSGYPGQAGSGYQGGQVGSGYPGQAGSGYPGQAGSGYQGGQIGSGYPGSNQQGSYPKQIYPQQAYPQQGGYQGNQRQTGYQQYGGYPQTQAKPNSGTSISDKISDGLKSIGLFCVVLKYIYTRLLSI